MPFIVRKKIVPEDVTGVGLEKRIGVLQGVSIVVGIIVGSGIFVSPVGVLQNTKSVGLSLIMWVVTGLFSTLGAIIYAELGVTIPRSGGEYIYILETFGPFMAFIALWITFVIGTVSAAANALVFSQYILRPFFFTCNIPPSALQMISLLALMLLCFFNCYRVTWATRLAVVFTTCKIVALVTIIIFGFIYIARGKVNSFQDSFEDSATSPGALANAFYQGFWAFSGWNYLNFLTGEMKNPARNMPIVIIISMTTVTTIYVLANMAYLAVLSPFEVLTSGEGSAAVAVTFALRCMGVMAWIMPIFVGASVFGSINSEILSLSRLCFTAGEEGHMPALLSMVSLTNLTPIPSILVMVLLSILFQFYPDVFVLIKFTGFAFTVVSSLAVCSLLHIKRTRPELNETSFKLPIFLPILYLVVNLSIGIFSIYDAPMDALLCIALMVVGIPLYVVGIAWKSKPKIINVSMYKITTTMQKVFNVVQQQSINGPIEILGESKEQNDSTRDM